MERRGVRFRDADFSFGDDYFLWLALLLDGGAVLVDEVLVRLRRHTANESARLSRRNFHLQRIELLAEFLRRFPEAAAKLGPAKRFGLARHWGFAAAYELDARRRQAAARYAGRAALLDPGGAGRYAARLVRRRLSRA
jgi:hypothetical protein